MFSNALSPPTPPILSTIEKYLADNLCDKVVVSKLKYKPIIIEDSSGNSVMSLEDTEAIEMLTFFFLFSMDIYPSTLILKTIILIINILITKKSLILNYE